MNRYAFFILLFFSLRLSCQNIFTSLDSALVACYSFSGNANDLSGNNLHGNVNNVTLVADRFGNPNSAYSFGGASNQGNIIIPGFSQYLNGTGISISFWTSKTVSGFDAAFLITPDNTSNRLSFSPYYNGVIYWDYGNISGNGRLGGASSPLPASNVWDHWVVTSNQTANTMKVYKNGVLFSSKTSASSFVTTPLRDLCIGGATGVSSGLLWYNGKLDDIRIYTRELLAAEVSYIYTNNVSCAPCPVVSTPTNATAASTLCAGNTITLSASGTPTLYWYNTSTSYLSLGTGTNYSLPSQGAPGTYTYFVRMRNGCNSSSPLGVSYSVNPIPFVQASSSAPLVCAGQSVQLSGSGASNYTWSPVNLQSGTVTVSPLLNTLYTLSGESGGCTSTVSIVVSVAALPSVSIAASHPTVCLGKTVFLSASGAASYTWQPGNIPGAGLSISPLVTTSYTLTGQTGICTNTAVITLPVVNNPPVVISGNTIICLGTTANLLATGAVNYTWSPGNAQGQILSISPTANTTYSVVGEASGCTNTAAISMSVSAPPSVSLAASALSVCPGKTSSLTATGANNYSWTTGNTASSMLVSPASTTGYTVTGFGANNCSGTATLTVFVYTVSTIQIVPTATAICKGESLDLAASGASNYTWSTGTQSNTITLSPLVTTTYTVTGSDSISGCLISKSFVAIVDECTSINTPKTVTENRFSIFPNPNNGSFRILGSGKGTILSQTGQVLREFDLEGTNEIVISDLAEGLYFVISEGAGGKTAPARTYVVITQP